MNSLYQFLLRIQGFIRRQPRWVAMGIKTLVFVFFIGMLYFQIFRKDNINDIWSLFRSEMRGENVYWLITTIALMPLNWASETMKWHILVRRVQPLGFWLSLKAVFAGVTFSLFTPNRIGEYGGRILFVNNRNIVRTIFATIVGTFAQQLVLLTVGFIGLCYFLYRLFHVDLWILQGIVTLSVLVIAILVFCFINLELLVPLLRRIKWLHQIRFVKKNVNIVRQYTKKELGNVLAWASIRYVVYSLQYYMMLRFFGINPPLMEAFACISTVYLLQTSIPLPPMIGLIARGDIALQVWGNFSENPIAILSATFSLWVINLIFPALIGLIFILQANLVRSLIGSREQKRMKNEKLSSNDE